MTSRYTDQKTATPEKFDNPEWKAFRSARPALAEFIEKSPAKPWGFEKHEEKT